MESSRLVHAPTAYRFDMSLADELAIATVEHDDLVTLLVRTRVASGPRGASADGAGLSALLVRPDGFVA
jgi:hypothetical protein